MPPGIEVTAQLWQLWSVHKSDHAWTSSFQRVDLTALDTVRLRLEDHNCCVTKWEIARYGGSLDHWDEKYVVSTPATYIITRHHHNSSHQSVTRLHMVISSTYTQHPRLNIPPSCKIHIPPPF